MPNYNITCPLSKGAPIIPIRECSLARKIWTEESCCCLTANNDKAPRTSIFTQMLSSTLRCLLQVLQHLRHGHLAPSRILLFVLLSCCFPNYLCRRSFFSCRGNCESAERRSGIAGRWADDIGPVLLSKTVPSLVNTHFVFSCCSFFFIYFVVVFLSWPKACFPCIWLFEPDDLLRRKQCLKKLRHQN